MSVPGPGQPPVFQGMTFVVDLVSNDGDPQQEINSALVNDIVMHGGKCVGESYSPDSMACATHVVVRHMQQASARAARAAGLELVSEYWVRARCRFQHPPEVKDEIFWRPAPHPGSPEGSQALLVCITGYTGVERKMLTFACQWGGFAFEAQLTRNTTHLLCFQHSGAKWEAARRWAAESIQAGRPGTPFIVNHRWLVDCLSAWEVLPPEEGATQAALVMLQYCAAEKYQEHSGEALMADPTVLACSWQQLHGRRPTAAAGQRTASDDAEEKESTPPDEELAAEAAAGHDHLSGQEEAEDAPEPEVVVQGAEPGELQPCEAASVDAHEPLQPGSLDTPASHAIEAGGRPSSIGRLSLPSLPSTAFRHQPWSSVKRGPTLRSAGAAGGHILEPASEAPANGTPSAARGNGWRQRRRSSAIRGAGTPLPAFATPQGLGGSAVPMERPSGTGPLSAEEAGNPATGCEVQPSGRNLGMEVEDAGVCGRSSVKRQRQALSSEGLVGQGSDAAGQEIPALAELHKPREAHIRPEADLDTSQDKRGEKLGTGGRGKPTRLVGRRLAKRFGRKTYYGTVLAWNAAMRHFRVKYDDSDAEDLSREELEALLIPEGPGEPEPPAKRRKAAAAGSGKTNKAVDGTGDRAANADGRLQRSEPCLALSGFHTDTKRHYTDVIHRLGASKSRKSDLHAWDKEVTHLVMPELKRMEKTVAAMAAGAWLLRAEYLDCSLVEGRLLAPEDEYEHKRCSTSAKSPPISEAAPRHWRLRRGSWLRRAFEGMRVLLYGKLEAPGADTVARIVEAGGGVVTRRSQPYTAALEDGADLAVVQRAKPETDRWVQAFKAAGVLCVSEEYIVDWVAHPQAKLSKHYLFQTTPSKGLAAAEEERGMLNPS